CGVVRDGAALFGEPPFGLHVPHAIVRRRLRPFRARGTDLVGVRAGGRAGGGRPGAGEPAELTGTQMAPSPACALAGEGGGEGKAKKRAPSRPAFARSPPPPTGGGERRCSNLE